MTHALYTPAHTHTDAHTHHTRTDVSISFVHRTRSTQGFPYEKTSNGGSHSSVLGRDRGACLTLLTPVHASPSELRLCPAGDIPSLPPVLGTLGLLWGPAREEKEVTLLRLQRRPHWDLGKGTPSVLTGTHQTIPHEFSLLKSHGRADFLETKANLSQHHGPRGQSQCWVGGSRGNVCGVRCWVLSLEISALVWPTPLVSWPWLCPHVAGSADRGKILHSGCPSLLFLTAFPADFFTVSTMGGLLQADNCQNHQPHDYAVGLKTPLRPNMTEPPVSAPLSACLIWGLHS